MITSEGQFHLTAHQSCRQLLVPRSLQTSRDVRQSAQQHVFFDDEAWEPTSSPIQAHVEIAVSVEVVWSHEHVMISDGDHNGKIKKAALRVSPVRSLEILKFFAAKMVAQIGQFLVSRSLQTQQKKSNGAHNNTYSSSMFAWGPTPVKH